MNSIKKLRLAILCLQFNAEFKFLDKACIDRDYHDNISDFLLHSYDSVGILVVVAAALF